MHQRAVGLERNLWIGDRGKRLEVDLDELESRRCDLGGAGRDRSDDLSFEPHDSIREQGPVLDRAAVMELRNICLRDHGCDPRKAPSLVDVDLLDPRMCVAG